MFGKKTVSTVITTAFFSFGIMFFAFFADELFVDMDRVFHGVRGVDQIPRKCYTDMIYYFLFMATLSGNPVSNPKATPANFQPRRGGGFFLFLAFLAVIAVVAGSFYGTFALDATKQEKAQVKQQVDTLNEEVRVLKAQKIESVQLTQNFLKQLEIDEVHWSQVINQVQNLIPRDDKNQEKVKFLSYTGSGKGKIVMNAQTRSSNEEPYADVAELIATFNQSAKFKDAYVPTLTRGETDNGQKTLSFVFNATFYEKSPEELLQESRSVLSDSSVSPSKDTSALNDEFFTTTEETDSSASSETSTETVPRVSRQPVTSDTLITE